ncbi:Protein trachealess [Eumeta japonica]|uniref:Protein trachealess n=1 Tax=Eumeta variegata TaxID=151549 RepID=A0A4C1U756_EUMVA|nr:Protein trachealess [Eumeta japonica]
MHSNDITLQPKHFLAFRRQRYQNGVHFECRTRTRDGVRRTDKRGQAGALNNNRAITINNLESGYLITSLLVTGNSDGYINVKHPVPSPIQIKCFCFERFLSIDKLRTTSGRGSWPFAGQYGAHRNGGISKADAIMSAMGSILYYVICVLLNKGQVLTHYYRLMNKLGGYTWMQTCATVICSSKNTDEQNIICVNYVISGREYPNTVMDCCQLEESVQGVKREEATGDPENGPPDSDTPGAPPPPRHAPDRPEAPTADNPSTAPVPTTDVTHLTRLNDTQPIPLQAERTSPLPTRRLKKRKHTDCEEETSERDEEARRKSTSNPGANISPAERDAVKTTLPITESTPDATSVRDLENAMSKHLPAAALDGKEISHRPTDFSTDALLKQQQQKSTIQWIGTQNHHLNHLNRQIPGNHTSTPASALLRQLYANRESVIRSNFLGDGRTGGYYSSDGQTGPLPTPPGSEGSGYGEQLGHKGTELGTLAYGGYADYHSAMTPPGSVSPRDKQQYALSYDNTYSEALRHSYLGEAPLPLKPQAYSAVPGALDYASSLDQSQFFHPPSSFHLYHPQAHPAHASHTSHQNVDKSAPPNTNWYAAGS